MTSASERRRLSRNYYAGGAGEARRICKAAKERSERWRRRSWRIVRLCDVEVAVKRYERDASPQGFLEVSRALRTYLDMCRTLSEMTYGA